jgi:hypothetical protein
MEPKITCPLGHTCEKVVDDHIEMCAWFIEIAGQDPQTGEAVNPKRRCSLAWLPILSIEMSMTNRGQTKAIELLTNSTAQGQGKFNRILETAARKKVTG